jgi:hypothetical protein
MMCLLCFSLGLKYDREWLLQGSDGQILTQKKVTDLFLLCMCFRIDFFICGELNL